MKRFFSLSLLARETSDVSVQESGCASRHDVFVGVSRNQLMLTGLQRGQCRPLGPNPPIRVAGPHACRREEVGRLMHGGLPGGLRGLPSSSPLAGNLEHSQKGSGWVGDELSSLVIPPFHIQMMRDTNCLVLSTAAKPTELPIPFQYLLRRMSEIRRSTFFWCEDVFAMQAKAASRRRLHWTRCCAGLGGKRKKERRWRGRGAHEGEGRIGFGPKARDETGLVETLGVVDSAISFHNYY